MRRAALLLLVGACSRGGTPNAEPESSAPGPQSKSEDARGAELQRPPARAPSDPAEEPAPAAPKPDAAAAPECWTLADEAGRAWEACITVTVPGRSLDEMTTSRSGRVLVTRGGETMLDATFASVQEDGAAGSVYTTHRSEAGDPILVVRRAGDCEQKCVREIRLPTLRGEPVLTRECDVSCAD